MTTSTKVNSFTILKTKNQFILLCWKKKIMAYVHQLLDQPSQWQTSQQAGPCSVPKFTSTSITVKHLLIKNKNINQSKSSLLIWHYVSYLFLFKDLNWLPFPKRVQHHTCLMVYKSITGQAPEYISSMLTYVSEHHERQTRSTVLDLLYIPWSHSAYFDRAFSVQGTKLWNSLPADIRNSTSINRFKRELKRYLLYNN